MEHAGARGVAFPTRMAMATGLALAGILACAGLVRLVGIDFGRPFGYHPDEWIVFRPAFTMVHDRDWD
ncbi:MAG: hypothetical protein QOC97_1422, partial [Chloroflexota bacterium]|nr:hypothetical protein [Chloroflexota bacterium]